MGTDKFLGGDEWLSLMQRRHGEKDVAVIIAKDETLFVPINAAGEVIFTIEPSPALGQDVLILPGGGVEPDEPVDVAGNRELQEEIGFRAERIDFVAKMHPWAKYLEVATYIYVARGLIASKLQGDEDYQIGVQRVALNDFEGLIASGELTDSRVIAALYLTRRFLQQ